MGCAQPRFRRCAQQQPRLERQEPFQGCRRARGGAADRFFCRRHRHGLGISEVLLILIELIAMGCPSRSVRIVRGDRERHVLASWDWAAARPGPASTLEALAGRPAARRDSCSGVADSSAAALSRFSLGRRPSPSSSKTLRPSGSGVNCDALIRLGSVGVDRGICPHHCAKIQSRFALRSRARAPRRRDGPGRSRPSRSSTSFGARS